METATARYLTIYTCRTRAFTMATVIDSSLKQRLGASLVRRLEVDARESVYFQLFS